MKAIQQTDRFEALDACHQQINSIWTTWPL